MIQNMSNSDYYFYNNLSNKQWNLNVSSAEINHEVKRTKSLYNNSSLSKLGWSLISLHMVNDDETYKKVLRWARENNVEIEDDEIIITDNTFEETAGEIEMKYYTESVLSQIPNISIFRGTIESGHAVLRVLDHQNETLWDICSLQENIFEVDVKVQAYLTGWFDNSTLRNIVSFLSPCVSKTCSIWCNKNGRFDTDPSLGHVFSSREMLSMIQSQTVTQGLNSLPPKMISKIAEVEEAILSDRIDVSLPYLTYNYNLRPCFNLLGVLEEAATSFRMKNTDPKVLKFISTHKSVASRGNLGTKMTRGNINLLAYVAYIYRRENDLDYQGAIQKYPAYDWRIHRIIEKQAKKEMVREENYKNERKAPHRFLSGFTEYDIELALIKLRPPLPVNFEELIEEIRKKGDFRRKEVIVNAGDVVEELRVKQTWLSRKVKIRVDVPVSKKVDMNKFKYFDAACEAIQVKRKKIAISRKKKKKKEKENRKKGIREPARPPTFKGRTHPKNYSKKPRITGYTVSKEGAQTVTTLVNSHDFFSKKQIGEMNFMLRAVMINARQLASKFKNLDKYERMRYEARYAIKLRKERRYSLEYHPFFIKRKKIVDEHQKTVDFMIAESVRKMKIREKLKFIEEEQRAALKKVHSELLVKLGNFEQDNRLFDVSDY